MENRWTGSGGESSWGRYRVIGGPATLTIGSTVYTPGVAIVIEDNGVAAFGPSFDPAILNWVMEQARAEPEAGPAMP